MTMQILPSFDDFARAYRAGKNQTVWTRLVSDTETPVSAMLKLGHDRPWRFLLESIEGGAVRGRYSIIGRDPDLVWRCESGGRVSINRAALHDKEAFAPSAAPPMEDLRALIDSCKMEPDTMPHPMAAGLFGYLGYDTVRYMERLPEHQPDVLGTPEAVLIRPTLLAIFDQLDNTFTLAAPVWFDKEQTAEQAWSAAQQRLQAALDDLARPLPAPHIAAPSSAKAAAKPATQPATEPTANMTEAQYCAMVEKAKEYIRAGDIFQVVLAQRFSRPYAQPPFALYRAIRRLDPSPFLYFFDLAGFSIVGSSPEILVRARDGKITIRPIAGTRPRGAGNRTDKELEAELLADPKELAEHLMLVDLGRNDVGRAAIPGTVRVTARNTVEYYKHVMHIVSNVEGELRPDISPLDALACGFPAGTVSGAPKIRAMEIIAELEPDRRGVYAGCIGYFGAGGAMDTCIAIRTALVKDGMLHVQAGAGIVYDSNPPSEYRECAAKARGMLTAGEAGE